MPDLDQTIKGLEKLSESFKIGAAGNWENIYGRIFYEKRQLVIDAIKLLNQLKEEQTHDES